MSYWTDLRTPAELELVVGFYDLVGYTRFSERTEPLPLLNLVTGYHSLVGGLVQEAGGAYIKAIGDAGLFVFQDDHADAAVQCADAMLDQGDAWLTVNGYAQNARLGLHSGPVAVGHIGAPGEERLDIIGKTVNVCARLVTHRMTVTPSVFRKLSPESRKRFKKHTPPISYIGVKEPRPRDDHRGHTGLHVGEILPSS